MSDDSDDQGQVETDNPYAIYRGKRVPTPAGPAPSPDDDAPAVAPGDPTAGVVGHPHQTSGTPLRYDTSGRTIQPAAAAAAPAPAAAKQDPGSTGNEMLDAWLNKPDAQQGAKGTDAPSTTNEMLDAWLNKSDKEAPSPKSTWSATPPAWGGWRNEMSGLTDALGLRPVVNAFTQGKTPTPHYQINHAAGLSDTGALADTLKAAGTGIAAGGADIVGGALNLASGGDPIGGAAISPERIKENMGSLAAPSKRYPVVSGVAEAGTNLAAPAFGPAAATGAVDLARPAVSAAWPYAEAITPVLLKHGVEYAGAVMGGEYTGHPVLGSVAAAGKAGYDVYKAAKDVRAAQAAKATHAPMTQAIPDRGEHWDDRVNRHRDPDSGQFYSPHNED